MRALFIICSFTIICNLLQAQVCTPDTSIIPTNSIIYPVPYQDTVPNSGITLPACIGVPYELIFQVKVPTTITNPFPLTINRAKITGIDGLPAGLTYACEPSNCDMPAGTAGCIRISGTPTSANNVGDYSLKVNFDLITAIGVFPFSFPNPALAPGTYILKLKNPSSGNCVANTNSILNRLDAFNVYYDGINQRLNIEVKATEPLKGEIYLMDLLGNMLQKHLIKTEMGMQELVLNTTNLKSGVYCVALKSQNDIASKKIIIY